MLQPKKTKYRKMQKQRMKGTAHRGHQISFGSFAIKTLEEYWITGRQIEAARQAITRFCVYCGGRRTQDHYLH